MTLRFKLSLFNILSKVIFGSVFLLVMPIILERINTIQTDNQLIAKREQVIDLVAMWGVEFFLEDENTDAFGSYNILKEEYISLERVDLEQDWNFIEITQRRVDDEIIDYRVLNYSFYVDGEMYLLEIGKSLSSIRQQEKNIRTITLFFLLVFLLFTSFSDLSYAAWLIRPLEKISQKLRKTNSPLVYDSKPVLTSTQEFKQLDATLTRQMEKIKELFEKEKQITDNISHELLTPVSVLRITFENLLSRTDIPDEVAERIEDSLKTLYRLKSMVSSLLLIARVESEQYLRKEQFSVTLVLREILEELRPIADDKNITLQLLQETDAKINNANRHLIFIMFYNVVNNALKFTPREGKVSIVIRPNNHLTHISILDSGPGISIQDQDHLFSRFRKRPMHPNNGSGMGLAITKSIADFHQIDIKVTSQPGKGTEFRFIF